MQNKKFFLASGIIFLFDLIIKEFLLHYLTKTITVIDSFFSILLVKNTGGAFSVFSGNTFLLAIIGFFFLIFIVKYIKEKTDTPKWEKWCLSFILGGLVGNLWDRIIRGGVIDYLSFQFGNYSFPVFNLADIFITLGVIGIILFELRGEIHESRNRKYKNR